MASTDRYRSIQDLPSDIPVFPLRGCILLPRAMLPLSIFEPRYLEMIDDALAQSRVIGIVQPATSEGGAESPAGKMVELRRIGCLGRLTNFEELPDGRMSIMLTGIARFTIEDEVATGRQYRRMRVSYAAYGADLVRGVDEDGIDREALLGVLRPYLASAGLQVDWTSIERASAELIVNVMGMMARFAPEEKQALLEAPTLKDRADVLMTLARMALAGGGSDAAQGRLQ